MASVFGFAELKSKLEGWRAGLADVGPLRSWLPGVSTQRDDAVPDYGPNDLSLLLENLVIPRLVAERGPARLPVRPTADVTVADRPQGRAITAADVDDFADRAVADDAPALLDFVELCLASGRTVESLYIDLLAPAARQLGEAWEADRRDFVEVTMGLWRIQEVLRELGQRCPPPPRADQGLRRALFAPMPGEQHSFGSLMVADCFQRAGWECDVLIEPSVSELNAKVAQEAFDLVGLTVSCDCSSAALTGLVTGLRAVSANSGVRILVGGRVINARPELVTECNADASAGDAVAAVAVADRLVPSKSDIFGNLG